MSRLLRMSISFCQESNDQGKDDMTVSSLFFRLQAENLRNSERVFDEHRFLRL